LERGRGIVAVARDADDFLSQAQGEEDLGDIRREGDNPLRRLRQSKDIPDIVFDGFFLAEEHSLNQDKKQAKKDVFVKKKK
jgi:hypothetical protein